ncbi:DUF2927 domain-containing protein [Oceanibium sediminis]|uniref:DUF2927 domain-containing protein n=1 Tax=Oceanibium sediminis TaxID=2026339 RepID=UPI000DD2BACC|nr:DUF2927 domain-containing protein [Oceanibium sediminis]
MPKRSIALGLAALLAACTPVQRHVELSGPALERLYAETSNEIARKGGLRTDRIPADAPISLSMLVRNFEEISFFAENDGGAARTPSSVIPLTRWEGPIRIGVIFGESVPPDQRARDLAEVRALADKFRRLTGRDVSYRPDGDVNFIVLVLERNEQLTLASQIEQGGGLPRQMVDDLRNSPPSLLCSASLFGPDPANGGIAVAVALIKAEHRGILRRSCFHEEMTQALGLLNDSEMVRPSIFNDNEEFALLTLHDEILLRMLYDKRLTSGMSADEARPQLYDIARDAARAAGARLVKSPPG